MSDILRLRKLPLFRLLLPYIAGILGTYYLGPVILKETKLVIFFLIALLVMVFVCFFVRSLYKFFNIVLVLVVLALGGFITSIQMNFEDLEEGKKQHLGVIYEQAVLKENSILIPVRIQKTDSHPHSINSRVYLYTSKDSVLFERLSVGDQLTFIANLNPIRNNGNPNEFDYKRFMYNRGVVYQAYAPDSLIKNLGYYGAYRLKRIAAKIESKIVSIFQSATFTENSKAIIIALTVGNKEYISDELRASFANSGAIHVLAVSGLHVGIIYLILNFLLTFLDRNKKLKVLKTILVIVFIWGYALLTGFSPSVTRAALMFSLFNIGSALNRDISFFNIMAGAALIMLVINPLNIFEVGFQLSFLAVGGIVYFQPIFYKWLSFDHWFLDNVYKLFTVSLAAQITTFPLTLYYFHQFPVYFWLTNILIIPLVSVLVGLVVLFLVFSWTPILSSVIGSMLNGAAWLTNSWVSIIDDIPGAVIENISIGFLTMMMLYLLIIFVSGWLQQRNQFKLLAGIFVALVLELLPIKKLVEVYKSNELVIYNNSKVTAIALYAEENNQLLYSSDNENAKEYLEYSVKSHWIYKGIANKVSVSSIDSIFLNPQRNASNFSFKSISLDNKKLVFYEKNCLKQKEIIGLKADILIVEPNVFPPRGRLNADSIIVDGRVSNFLSEKWSDYANEYEISFHDTKKQGALIINFNNSSD